MKYFKNPEDSQVYGYDELEQLELIDAAKSNGWVDVSDTWPETPQQIITDEQMEARNYLISTDWYVMRMVETGEPIPADVLSKRATARTLL